MIQARIICGLIKSLKLSQAASVILIFLDSSPNPFWIAFKDSITSTSSLSWPLPTLVPMALVLPVMWLLLLCLCFSPTHPSQRKCHHFLETFPKHAGAFGYLEWLFCLGLSLPEPRTGDPRPQAICTE